MEDEIQLGTTIINVKYIKIDKFEAISDEDRWNQLVNDNEIKYYLSDIFNGTLSEWKHTYSHDSRMNIIEEIIEGIYYDKYQIDIFKFPSYRERGADISMNISILCTEEQFKEEEYIPWTLLNFEDIKFKDMNGAVIQKGDSVIFTLDDLSLLKRGTVREFSRSSIPPNHYNNPNNDKRIELTHVIIKPEYGINSYYIQYPSQLLKIA